MWRTGSECGGALYLLKTEFVLVSFVPADAGAGPPGDLRVIIEWCFSGSLLLHNFSFRFVFSFQD